MPTLLLGLGQRGARFSLHTHKPAAKARPRAVVYAALGDQKKKLRGIGNNQKARTGTLANCIMYRIVYLVNYFDEADTAAPRSSCFLMRG